MPWPGIGGMGGPYFGAAPYTDREGAWSRGVRGSPGQMTPDVNSFLSWMLQANPANEYYIRRAFAGGSLSDPAYNAMKETMPGVGRDVVGERFQRIQDWMQGGGTERARELGGGALGELETWGAQSGMGRSGAFADALRALETEYGREKGTVEQEQAARLAQLGQFMGAFGGMTGGAGAGAGGMTGRGSWNSSGRGSGGQIPYWSPAAWGAAPGAVAGAGSADLSGWSNPYQMLAGFFGGQRR